MHKKINRWYHCILFKFKTKYHVNISSKLTKNFWSKIIVESFKSCQLCINKLKKKKSVSYCFRIAASFALFNSELCKTNRIQKKRQIREENFFFCEHRRRKATCSRLFDEKHISLWANAMWIIFNSQKYFLIFFFFLCPEIFFSLFCQNCTFLS